MLYFVFPFGIMTSQRTGKAKHRTDTSREVAAMPRTEEASTSTEHGKPQAHGSGKARDGREEGEVKTISAKKPPSDRRCTRMSGKAFDARVEHTRLRIRIGP